MTKLTPELALKLYRAQAPMDDSLAAAQFMKLPIGEQLELLFYMQMSTNRMMQKIVFPRIGIAVDLTTDIDLEDIGKGQ